MKFNYKEYKIEDIVFNIVRSRCRTMHISVKSDGKVYAVCPKFVSDEEFIKFLTDKLSWVRKSINKVKDVRDNIPERISNKELGNKVLMLVKKYSLLMGVSVNKISFRKMTTRWGSCTKTNKTIRFSTMLTKCNDAYIEYIVVHELAHLIEANHGKRFWNIVIRYVPDYKTREKKKYDFS